MNSQPGPLRARLMLLPWSSCLSFVLFYCSPSGEPDNPSPPQALFAQLEGWVGGD